jgi:protein tyrosine/serine phosphatase
MWPIVLAVSVGVVLVVLALWAWRVRLATFRFAAVHCHVLYRHGNRTLREFRTATRRCHAKTVVMLADDDETSHDPSKSVMDFCREQGIDVVRIPIGPDGWPTTDQVTEFLGVVTDQERQPVLLHCATGIRRTCMFAAAYQESILGYDNDRAKSAIMTFGRNGEVVEDVRRFIDMYEPRKRVMRDA